MNFVALIALVVLVGVVLVWLGLVGKHTLDTRGPEIGGKKRKKGKKSKKN